MKRRWKLPQPPRAALVYVLAGAILLAGGTSFVLVPILIGPADALPVIHIQEPAAWAAWAAGAPEPGDVVVAPTRSLPIRGLARHTSPIAEVRLGGKRLAATFGPDRTIVEFSGFFDAADLRTGDFVELEVRSVGGATAVRRLPVRIDPSGDPGPSAADIYQRERHQRWAVVIGVDTHDDPRIQPLEQAGADAIAIADVLRAPGAGLNGFAEDHVSVLTGADATARNMRSALKTFLRSATPGDLVLIYVAGRTLPDPDRPGRWYLATRDTDLDDLPATALDMGSISSAVEEVFGHTRVVMADLVHDGRGWDERGAPGDARDPATTLLEQTTARQGGLAILTLSATGSQRGLAPRHGFLARGLINGLAGAADVDRDGTIRVQEILAHVRRRATDDPGPQLVPVLSATAYDRSWPIAAAAHRSLSATAR